MLYFIGNNKCIMYILLYLHTAVGLLYGGSFLVQHYSNKSPTGPSEQALRSGLCCSAGAAEE